ncbi:PH, RCC1 and FYVE domains-containing protein 1-like [Solanum stenotomum]|uniref:PH, RCC1 and FYVE domains-containing protein 1-like n=1 Tax=Solanum stenotomum TaxID=172797 RepID=UPI0020D1111E|nr:PH, RCC1 and FYVE domains-containing protein 1-like [Solanum stenotomum]XP_049393542.1 PH, RCC1 and FYVE domains-containing protein 1-like [Solanum stenotomum]
MNNVQRNSLGERSVEQAITALKRGSYLLKYGRKGKPKFCPFRLSTDETRLIWYVEKEEKQLQLSQVSRIIPGQRTANFQRFPRPEKEYQSFSLLYGKSSLDLICKDKEEAEVWFVALRALTSRVDCQKWTSDIRHDIAYSDGSPSVTQRSSHSALSSSSGSSSTPYEDPKKNLLGSVPSQSPPRKRLERAFSDYLLYNSAAKCSSHREFAASSLNSRSYGNLDDEIGQSSSDTIRSSFSSAISSSSQGSFANTDTLCDILIWGEGIGDGLLGGGMCGLGKFETARRDAPLPRTLESALLLDAQYVACGSRHAVLITKQGDIFSWGEGLNGRLGHGVESDVSSPKLIDTLCGLNVTSAACGDYHTCATTISGDLYTWGEGTFNFGLLGHDTGISHWIPKKVRGPLVGKHVSYVSCGPWHSAVITSVGQLFTFGDGTFGALGHGDRCSIGIPREVETLQGLRTVRVACGHWHTAAVVELSFDDSSSCNSPPWKLFTWGNGDDGQLGHEDNASGLTPCKVVQLDGINFSRVACGHSITVALTTLGQVYTMGKADYGQLGIPGSTGKFPSRVQGKITDCFIEEIACGSFHVVSLSSNSELYTWGKGGNGQLGHGDNHDRNTPTLVEALKAKKVKDVVCGNNFTAAICLHREVSVADNSICAGCQSPFNLRRKRHNCYNCGLVFCTVCTSRRSVRASLAPKMNKPYRVCEDCFTKLNRGLDIGLTCLPPKATIGSLQKNTGERSKETSPSKQKGLLSRLSSFNSFRSDDQRFRKNQKQDSNSDNVSPIPNGNTQSEVSQTSSRLLSFSSCPEKLSVSFVGSTSRSQAGSPASFESSSSNSVLLRSAFAAQANHEVDLDDSKQTSESLKKEISILKEQVEILTQRSLFLEAELEKKSTQLQEKTEEARIETDKNNAAKEVIKSLMTQVKGNTARAPQDGSAENLIHSTMTVP